MTVPNRMWFLALLLLLTFVTSAGYASASTSENRHEEFSVSDGQPAAYGGHLTVSLRSEPKTLNPIMASDIASREVTGQMTADLIHINRQTQLSDSALARSWKVSADGCRYTLELRRGLRFSDGAPLDADDVLFSFKVYSDDKVNAPQRNTLLVDGTPIIVRKVDPYTITFALARPYASAERLFDSVAILPRHLLENAYSAGKLVQAWSLDTPPNQIAGLGPFRLKEYVRGQRLTLERNPYFWKKDRHGNQLPYLDGITFLFVGSEDAQVLRFEAGEIDIIDRVNARNYSVLNHESGPRRFHLYDLGPDLDYNFLLFNLNSTLPARSGELRAKQLWFNDLRFRQAISSSIDREGMNRIVYDGRGTPIWTHVTPGNRLWFDSSVPRPARSLNHAKDLLKAAGFYWRTKDGRLMDTLGTPVEFTVITSSSSNERTEMATMIQQDLAEVGIGVRIVPLDFHMMLDRLFETHDYEAAVMGLGGADVDPNSQMNVWLSSGDLHLWNLGQTYPLTAWEGLIDRLMKQQSVTPTFIERKHLYDQVQKIEEQEVPLVFLVSPHLLVGAKDRLRDFAPSVLDSHTLWNSEYLSVLDRNGDGR